VKAKEIVIPAIVTIISIIVIAGVVSWYKRPLSLSLTEVRTNATNYLGKEITVEGYIVDDEYLWEYYTVTISDGIALLDVYVGSVDVSSHSINYIFYIGDYKENGTVCRFKGILKVSDGLLYLEASEIEPR